MTCLKDEPDLRAEMIVLLPRLRRFAIGLAGNTADADDVLQSAVEKALGRLGQFEVGTRLDSWLFRIIQNTWIDSRRRAHHREVGMEADLMSRLPQAGTVNEGDTRHSLSDVDRALATLPDEQRLLVVLVLVEGHSYEEAAQLTGVPIGTVMSRLSRARRALVTQLRDALDD